MNGFRQDVEPVVKEENEEDDDKGESSQLRPRTDLEMLAKAALSADGLFPRTILLVII